MSDDTGETRAQRARRRALRAAHVATLSAVMMGCNLSHRVEPVTPRVDSGSRPIADSGSPPIADASRPFDAGSDAGTDAGVDAGVVCVTMEDAENSEACCTTLGGSWWSESCAWVVEGPGIPPSMSA